MSTGKLQIFRLSNAELYEYGVSVADFCQSSLTCGHIVTNLQRGSINASAERSGNTGIGHINLSIFQNCFLRIYRSLCLVTLHNSVIQNLLGNCILCIQCAVTLCIQSCVSQSRTGISQACLRVEHVGLISTLVNSIQGLACTYIVTALEILGCNLAAYLSLQLHFLLSLYKACIIIYQRGVTLNNLHGFNQSCLIAALLLFLTAACNAQYKGCRQRRSHCFSCTAGANKT